MSLVKFSWSSDPPSLERLGAILKLATFYQIEDGRNYAIATLDKRTDLRPAFQLYLAKSYHVSHWIRPAFCQLVATPTLSLTDEDIGLLGHDTFVVLMKVKSRIDLHRRACAVRAPPVVHGGGCFGQEDCEKAWRDAWWGEPDHPGVAVALIHPENPQAGSDIASKLNGISVLWHMDESCRDLTVAKVRGLTVPPRKSPLELEDTYIQTAVEDLTTMYGCY
jgi:hypothetical protein